MPRYDYCCEGCGHEFTKLVSYDDRDEVACPECEKDEVKRLISGFFTAGSGGGSSSGNCGGGGFT